MFRLILVFIFILNSTVSFSQQKILLIGTLHRTPTGRLGDIIPIAAVVESFQPDLICVEYRISTDTASLENSYVDERLDTIKSIRKSWNIPPGNLCDKIKVLENDPDLQTDITKRMELYRLYFVSADFANADYQSYLVMKNVSKDSSKAVMLRERFKGFEEMKSQYATKTSQNDEYSHLVFPLAAKLNISYLYPIDDLSSLKEFEKYFEILQNRDTSLADRKAHYQRIDDFHKKLQDLQLQKGNNEWIFANSPEIIKDLLYVEAYTIDKTSSEEIKMLSYYWVQRNKKMAQYIYEVAQLQPKKNIVVFFGASHVGAVREELNKLKGSYKVLTLFDITSTHK